LKFDGQLDLIEEIQNQWSNWKRHVNIRAEIDQIRGQIEEIKKFVIQLRVKIHKFKIKDQNEKKWQT
jgi:hypothetical protein